MTPGGPLDFHRMAELAREMVKESLSALLNLDTDLARKVLAKDDEVDEINRRCLRFLKKSC